MKQRVFGGKVAFHAIEIEASLVELETLFEVEALNSDGAVVVLIFFDGAGDESDEFIGVENVDFGGDELAVVFSPSFDEDGVFAKSVPEILKVFDVAGMDAVSPVAFLKGGKPFSELFFIFENFNIELASGLVELFSSRGV